MRAGKEIGNRKTGETLTMLISEERNGGAEQLYLVRLPAWRPSLPLHYHLAFTETFSVVEGVLDRYLGRKRRHITLKEHDSTTVQIGQLHTFANQRDEASIVSSSL